MFGSVVSVAGTIQMVLSMGALGFVLISALKPKQMTGEEDQRGGMRSMSWPAAH